MDGQLIRKNRWIKE